MRTTAEQGNGGRRGLIELGESRQRGCQARFTLKRLYKWPGFVEVSYGSLSHVDRNGKPCHGAADPSAAGKKHAYAYAYAA